MTALKGVLASNAALSALGVKLGLHRFIASNSAVLVEGIARYERGLEKILAQQEKGKEEGQYWTKLGERTVPKVVADVVEASFASIVVDSGFDEEVVEGVFDRIFRPFYHAHCRWESLRVGEVKRVIEYVSSCLKRAGGRGGGVVVFVKTNLDDFSDLIPTGSEGEIGSAEPGQGDAQTERQSSEQISEEAVVQALLTPLHLRLIIRGEVIAKLEGVLVKTLHFARAVRIVRELRELQHKMIGVVATNIPQHLMVEEECGLTASKAMDKHSDGDSGGEVAPKVATEVDHPMTHSKPYETTWSDLVEEQEHLLLQLARTLGWKSTFQSPLPPSQPKKEKEEAVMRLTQIRDLIFSHH